MKRLLKKEIKFVPVKVLNMRYCRILKHAEKNEAKDIPVADAREILWIEDELRERLITLIGHDFYPPDQVESKPTIKSLGGGIMKTKPAPDLEKKKSLRRDVTSEHKEPTPRPLTPAQRKPIKPVLGAGRENPKLGLKIKFKAVVKSSIGSKAAEINVEADSKLEADKMIRKEIRKLGLEGATYKIS